MNALFKPKTSILLMPGALALFLVALWWCVGSSSRISATSAIGAEPRPSGGAPVALKQPGQDRLDTNRVSPPDSTNVEALLTDHEALIDAVYTNRVTRESLGDAAYDTLLAEIARERCATVSEDTKKKWALKFAQARPLRTEDGLKPSVAAEVQALERQHIAYGLEAAKNIVNEIETELDAAWRRAEYSMWATGSTEPSPPVREADRSSFSFTKSTAVKDRKFRLRFESADHPALHAHIQELLEMRHTMEQERRRILAVAGK